MHIGNLRSALYEYLIAKSLGGTFVLRIEDTDRARYVPGAEKVIYETLKMAKLRYDEGPDVGGPFAPYVQSERKDRYFEYAKKLVKNGKAYYCFCCDREFDIDNDRHGYNRKCRDLPKSEAEKMIAEGLAFVIRQKVPILGSTTFTDAVYGKISISNEELEDQVLIKSDGLPTYNFANVVDDHEMKITHVVRGCEYLSSTPKYNLLYEAFDWKIPTYVHLPLIMGKNEDGTTSKLSKRNGSMSFEELIRDGFMPEAIVNYIAFLGWCPEGQNEIFSLEELAKEFRIERIGKSPAIFNIEKLLWINAKYLRNKTDEEFAKLAFEFIKEQEIEENYKKFILSLFSGNLKLNIAKMLQERTKKLSEIANSIRFLYERPEFEKGLFYGKKSKTDEANVPIILNRIMDTLENLANWNNDEIYAALCILAKNMNIKPAAVMWCARIAASGQEFTPGGATEILEILGKEESLKRLRNIR
jgi:glutamyl-tRNA synthetase